MHDHDDALSRIIMIIQNGGHATIKWSSRCISSYEYFVQHVLQAYIGSLSAINSSPLQYASLITKGFAWAQLILQGPFSLDVIW